MSYQDDLNHPLWQKKKAEIHARDNWACLACGRNDRRLTVHHVVYKKHFRLWEYPDYLYQTLCWEPCHQERQELADKIADALKITLSNVPTERMKAVATRFMAEAMIDIEVPA